MGSELYAKRMRDATRLTVQQQREIKTTLRKLYGRCAEQLARDVGQLKPGSLTLRWAEDYQKRLTERVHELWSDVNKLTRKSARKAAIAATEVQQNALIAAAADRGLDMHGTFSRVFSSTPDDALSALFHGDIYKGRGSLSRRIWRGESVMDGSLQQVIAQGIAKHQSPVQLAKALEAYLNPDAMQPDNWNEVYDIPFPLSVDYNAKRLAVTTINHAAWQATLMAGERNPFADYLHWELSVTHHVKDECDIYAKEDKYGLGEGNHPLDKAPLPHPFCKCTWYVDTDKSLEQIGSELGSWARGGSNERVSDAFLVSERSLFDISNDKVMPIGVISMDIPQMICRESKERLRTNIVVRPDERVTHYINRHPGDFETYGERIEDLIKHPQLMIRDKHPLSAHYIKKYSDGVYLRAIIRYATTRDLPYKVNSVLQFQRLGESTIRKLKRDSKNILYLMGEI